MTPLESFAADVPGPVLVLHDASIVDTTALGEQGHSVHAWDGPLPGPTTWGGVALVVADRVELRRVAAALPPLGRTRAVACWLTGEDRLLPLTTRPDWPGVARFLARRPDSGGAWTSLHLDGDVAVQALLRRLARCSTSAPFVTEGATTGPVPGGTGPGPLDEGVLNPIGFEPRPTEGMATLSADGPTGLRFEGVDGVDTLAGVGGRVVSALRRHRGVQVRSADLTPGLERAVAGLAMAGVPMEVEGAPLDARTILGDTLLDLLATDVDLDDPLAREEQSILLRRAALLTHSRPAWRERTIPAAPGRFPTCSVVLATRRPEQLAFALRQVSRQRSVDLELVVAGHGFEPDAGLVRDHLEGRPAEVLHLPEETLFGRVLDAGTRAASGDLVVKMDDDDWYGRDFLLDLLLAREYSGADVVGAPAEFVYLHELDRTVRSRDAGERFARIVAGGTLCLPRDLLHDLGGFRPVRRFCDRQLLVAAASAGASTYRTHGLGYRLRRTSSGHTWNPGLEFFLDGERVVEQWPGFLPSRILDPEPEDVPGRSSTVGQDG